MGELRWKKVMMGVLGGLGLVAGTTVAIKNAAPIWSDIFVALYDVLFTPLPVWLAWGIAVFCASALFVISYREWRAGEKAAEQQKRNDIADLARHMKELIRKTQAFLDSPGEISEDLEHALMKLKESLVRATAYEHRLDLFSRMDNMEKWCRQDPGGLRLHIQQILQDFGVWVTTYADVVPTVKKLSSLKDPFAPHRPHGLSR